MRQTGSDVLRFVLCYCRTNVADVRLHGIIVVRPPYESRERPRAEQPRVVRRRS